MFGDLFVLIVGFAALYGLIGLGERFFAWREKQQRKRKADAGADIRALIRRQEQQSRAARRAVHDRIRGSPSGSPPIH